MAARNLLLAGRSRKPGLGEIHGGERGVLLHKRENKLEQDCRGDILDPHEL